MPTAIEELLTILEQNRDKNFVQRIIKPDISPVLMNYAGPGTWGTHLMAYISDGGKFKVYPEIIQGQNGELKRLGRKEAIDYALKNNEFIQFDTEDKARWFGENYKRIWGGEYNK